MDRKQIIEKKKALGSITQSKTGDAILRKNVFETRVLRTRLSELEVEERRWKTNYSFEVREARKEAHCRETAKRRSFREVAGAVLAANKLKNLINTTQRSGNEVDAIEDPNEADIAEKKPKEAPKQSMDEEKLKEQQKTVRKKNESPNANNIDTSARQKIKTPLRCSSSLPEKSHDFLSPLFTRPRGETFTGRSFKTTELPRKVKSGIFTRGKNSNEISRGICSPSFLENPALIKSPMLDRRFLELEAVLVPMNQNEENTSENEEEVDESWDAASLRCESSMS